MYEDDGELERMYERENGYNYNRRTTQSTQPPMKSELKEDRTPVLPLREHEDTRDPNRLERGEMVGIGYRTPDHLKGMLYVCGAKVSRHTSDSIVVEMPLDGREITFDGSTGIQRGKQNEKENPEAYVLCRHVPPDQIAPEKYEEHHFAERYDRGEPFASHPIGKPCEEETYRLGHSEFDVVKAFEIIRDDPREPVQIDPEEGIGFISKHTYGEEEVRDPEAILQSLRDPNLRVPSKGIVDIGTGVDWQSVPRCNPDLAGILVFLSEEMGHHIIDGSHRLASAWQEGRESFPAYVLTPEESLQVCPELKETREG